MRRAQLEDHLAVLGDSFDDVFRRISAIGRYILENGSSEGWLNQHIIRLHSAILNDSSLSGLAPASEGLIREVGLFPYLLSADLQWRDELARESFRPSGEVSSKHVFHREQAHAFDVLAAGGNLVLSAPTSFGKSFLIDSLIENRRPKTVILIVPTLALLDEQRRRLQGSFGQQYRVIHRNDQELAADRGNILVLTQERLRDRDEIDHVDLLIVDEFYKLNGISPDSRSRCLNSMFGRYARKSDQIFLLGPNLDYEVDIARISAKRIDSDAVTVATVVHDHTSEPNKRKLLAKLLSERGDEKSLIFCKSPASARQSAEALIRENASAHSSHASQLGDWLAEHYHPEWVVASSLQQGIGMHHGAMPRSVSQQILHAFEDSNLNVLICTSTLIEGVNTKAQNVFIYDDKIKSKKFDYFSYRNISGRAGRFKKHMIGHVFLFNAPPEAETYLLEIPSLSDPHSLSDDFLIGVDGFGTEDTYAERRAQIEEDLDLPGPILEFLSSFPLEAIKTTAEKVKAELNAGNALVQWSGTVGYDQLAPTLAMGWNLAADSSLRSGEQAAFFAFRMLNAGGRTREYLDRIVNESEANAVQRNIDNALRAVRDVDFHVPSVLGALDIIVNHYSERMGLPGVDYLPMAERIESHYLPKHVKGLEEIGIPVPLGMKVRDFVSGDFDLDTAISTLRTLNDAAYSASGITDFEIAMLRAFL